MPGNPGIIGYYKIFLEKLHSFLNIPIWAVSYAGHAVPPPGVKPGLPSLRENPQLYDLQGQIDHKIDFIKQYVPENVNVTIVAHSIGAKMTIEALKDSVVRRKIKKAYLLFPALERLSETPNANAMWVKYPNIVLTISVFLAWVFSFLPMVIRECVISFILNTLGISSCHVAPTLQYGNPVVLKNVVFLALDKMKKVRELDDKALKEFSDILFLYYGAKDEWVPLTYYKEMTANHPEVQCMVCENGLEHAFSLNTSDKMADILTGIINQDQRNY